MPTVRQDRVHPGRQRLVPNVFPTPAAEGSTPDLPGLR